MSNFIVTERAATRIHQLLDGEGNPDLRLRVYVTGGGCAGFQYGFGFETAEDDDLIFAANTPDGMDPIDVVVDPISIGYLDGATLDYEVSLRGALFKIDNPQADTTCGCGASFSLKEDDA